MVTIVQLDTINNLANPEKIVKYDEENCKLVTEGLPSYPILGPQLHGGFCLSAEDAAKWKAHAQAECKAKKEASVGKH